MMLTTTGEVLEFRDEEGSVIEAVPQREVHFLPRIDEIVMLPSSDGNETESFRVLEILHTIEMAERSATAAAGSPEKTLRVCVICKRA